MQCVINLMAPTGEGQQSLALALLQGISLVERSLRTAIDAGLNDFIMLSDAADEAVREVADEVAKQYQLKLKHVIAKKRETDGELLLSCRKQLKGPFIYLSVLYQVDVQTLRKLLTIKAPASQLILAVDGQVGNKKKQTTLALRVQYEGDQVRAMSSDLTEFNGYVSGAILCPQALLDMLAAKQKDEVDATVAQGIQGLIRDDKVKLMLVGKAFWHCIDSTEALRRAEQRLMASLRHNPQDNPFKRHFLRPLSGALTLVLANSPLSTKWLLVINVVIAILAALLFSATGYGGLFFGAILTAFAGLMLISLQEVRQLRLERTPSMHWFSNMLAMYTEVILLAGLTLHVAQAQGRETSFLGLFAIIGSIMYYYTYKAYLAVVKAKPPKTDDTFITRDIRFAIMAVGAVLNLPTLVLLILAVFFNVIVIRRLSVWKA